jgi:hypothetical protein
LLPALQSNPHAGELGGAVAIYRVRNWDKHYENNRSRVLKKLGWLPIPNRLDNDGYVELVTHPSGPAHFGVWVAILQTASRCNPRGTLVRDNLSHHTVESIARITRMPADLVGDAIARLLSIGWLEVVSDQGDIIRHDGAMIWHDGDVDHVDDQSTKELKELNRTEGKDICASGDARLTDPCISSTKTKTQKPTRATEGLDPQQEIWFNEWWGAYWLHKAKKPARAAFGGRVRTEEAFQRVMAAIQAQSPEMLNREPQHRPHGATWLNQERWEDEAATPATAKRTGRDEALDKLYSEMK